MQLGYFGSVFYGKNYDLRWSVEPLLVAHESLLMEKIRLLCVMDMTFRRAANHRQITFEEIAQSTGLNQNEIECLVSILNCF